ncbi:MAG: hypothetical protein WD690_01915 [Vicinamibacterales bacterium]
MSRRVLVGALALAVAFGSAPFAAAQQQQQQQTPPPAQQPPAPPAQPAEPAIGFTSGSGMVFNVIKAANTADFEMVLGRLREALQKSENPARRQQAAAWKVYKSADPPQPTECPDGTQCPAIMYIFVFEKAIPGVDYDPVKILSEAFPTEVTALYEKLKLAYVTLNKAGMTMLLDMGTATAVGGQ